MIRIQEVKDGYLVSFAGKKHQFNEYINKIMSIEKKGYDFERKCWKFDAEGIETVKKMFKVDSSPQNKKSKDVILSASKKNVLDYQNIGKTMKLEPYEYQKEAIKFGLDKKEALIVYPCGAGKTPIGIGLYLEAKQNGLIDGKGMIVVKASLKVQWKKEIEKFSDLKSRIIQTPKEIAASHFVKIKRREEKIKRLEKKKGKEEEIVELKKEISELKKEAKKLFESQFKDDVDLIILNYEALRDAKVRNQIHKMKLDFIMADEVHYVKNKDSKRSKALYEFNYVPYKIGATATPVGKNPEDLFGIFKFIKPNLFSSWSHFSRLYIRYAGYGKIIGFKNLDKLRKVISPHIIVKTKEEISKQLPNLVLIQRHCDFEPKQLEAHNSIMEELDRLKEEELKLRSTLKNKEAEENPELARIEAMILAHQTFAQQLANSEELLELSESDMAKKYITGSKSSKLELLTELVEEIIDSGEKVAIFSRFKKMQDIITKHFKKHFPGIKIAYVHGELSDKERYEEVYNKFGKKDEYKVLLLTDAGAEGLNLSNCKYLIEYDLAESYAIHTQRVGRIERADSVHDTVFAYQLICNDSWDEIQQKIIDKKEGYDAELIKPIC